MPFTGTDWMKDCASEIQDIPLWKLPLPGSHDAGSYGAIHTRSLTQEKSITEQLNAGFRYFDFRVIYDDGVYFSHHGSDHSRDNTYTQYLDLKKPHPDDEKPHPWLFEEIRNFCNDHEEEIIIFSIADPSYHWGNDYFQGEVVKNFIRCIKRHFEPLLIQQANVSPIDPGFKKIPTYGECIKAKKRILILIKDENTKNFTFKKEDWNDPCIWRWSDCLRERFSGKGYIQWSWEEMVSQTISDQKSHLTSDRKPDYFWISQAVLGYNNVDTTLNGKSQNYEGASLLNERCIEAYFEWWHQYIDAQETNKPPNILLMDFSGVFDDFPQKCYSFIKNNWKKLKH